RGGGRGGSELHPVGVYTYSGTGHLGDDGGRICFRLCGPAPLESVSQPELFTHRRTMKYAHATIMLALASSFILSIKAANHREAPITSFDHKADITDVYAFRSYEPGSTDKVTMILCVDPLLEPGNGPNYFPFDPDILYEIKVDNNHDAVADVTFQFRFNLE